MLPFKYFFFKDIVEMSKIPLNKFEKRDLILRLLKEGKDISRDMSSCPCISTRDKTNSKRIREKEKIRK